MTNLLVLGILKTPQRDVKAFLTFATTENRTRNEALPLLYYTI